MSPLASERAIFNSSIMLTRPMPKASLPAFGWRDVKVVSETSYKVVLTVITHFSHNLLDAKKCSC